MSKREFRFMSHLILSPGARAAFNPGSTQDRLPGSTRSVYFRKRALRVDLRLEIFSARKGKTGAVAAS